MPADGNVLLDKRHGCATLSDRDRDSRRPNGDSAPASAPARGAGVGGGGGIEDEPVEALLEEEEDTEMDQHDIEWWEEFDGETEGQ